MPDLARIWIWPGSGQYLARSGQDLDLAKIWPKNGLIDSVFARVGCNIGVYGMKPGSGQDLAKTNQSGQDLARI